MVFFRLEALSTDRVGKLRSADLKHVHDEEDDQHKNDEDHDYELLVRSRARSLSDRYRCTVIVVLIRPVSAMIPTVTKKSLRNANLIAGTLEVTKVTAHRFILTIVTICGSIADKTLLNAVTVVATKKREQTLHEVNFRRFRHSTYRNCSALHVGQSSSSLLSGQSV